jgi:3-hydroxyisobutyrate dehydrogenase-like beta-hydroxyacid dehydrogenase
LLCQVPHFPPNETLTKSRLQKCAVFGEPSLATIGKLICVPAGPAAAVARIKPYLVGVVAQAVVDLSGEEAGKASLLKIIGNVLIMTTMETCAEINVFAEKTGLGVENAQKLIDNFPHAAAHTVYSNKMLNGDYYQKEVRIAILH